MSVPDDNDCATFSYDEVVAALRLRGVEATIEHSGGGCATVYIGNMVGEQADGELRFEALLGPGWFERTKPGQPTPPCGFGYAFGSVGESCFGADDDGDVSTPTYLKTADPGEIADLIVAFVKARRILADDRGDGPNAYPSLVRDADGKVVDVS